MADYDPNFVASLPDHTEWKGDQNAIFLDEDFVMTTSVFADIVGGTPPYTYSMETNNPNQSPWWGNASSLPTGLSINTETGFITGKPTETGSFDATFKVVDSEGLQPSEANSNPILKNMIITLSFEVKTKKLRDILESGAKTTDAEGNARWFSASLASNPTLMELATQARIAATLLQKNLQFVKALAETGKALLLLAVNALSAVLNAIADELEKLYNDLVNTGGYSIFFNGQETFPKDKDGNKIGLISASKEEVLARWERAVTMDNYNKIGKILKNKRWNYGRDKRGKYERAPLEADFVKWIEEKCYDVAGNKLSITVPEVPDDSSPNGTRQAVNSLSSELPSIIKVSVDPDISGWDYGKLFDPTSGIESNIFKPQTPNQLIAKITQKLQDENDPDTPFFTGGAQCGAIIYMIGIPDFGELSKFLNVMNKVVLFLGDTFTGAWKVIKDIAESAGIGSDDKPPEYEMTFYGVRGYEKHFSNVGAGGAGARNFPLGFEVGDYIIGEDSEWAFIVSRTEKSDEIIDGKKPYINLGTRPTIHNDLKLKSPFGTGTFKDMSGGSPYIVDQTVMLRQVGFGNSVEWFTQMYPGELVTSAYKETKTYTIPSGNGNSVSTKKTTYKKIRPGWEMSVAAVGVEAEWFNEEACKDAEVTRGDNPKTLDFESKGGDGVWPHPTSGSKVVYARKTLPAKIPTPMSPEWNAWKLGDWEACGEFLKNILIFADFLRDLASGAQEQIAKLIKFIDDTIKEAERIVASILELLAFFEALKDAGMFMLIVHDTENGGLLKGGTDALIEAIGNATGDDATPRIDENLNPLPPTFDPMRIKPPESLRFTIGGALVVGGPGADEGFETIKTILAPASTGGEGAETEFDLSNLA